MTALGDGRQMDLGEMVRLPNVLSLTVEREGKGFKATAEIAVEVETGPTGTWTVSRYGVELAPEPEPAARAAILAAVDGAK